jgi:hypothetical protein
MEFTLNGKTANYSRDPELKLSTYIREIADDMTCKIGCSGEGACGSCTVADRRQCIAVMPHCHEAPLRYFACDVIGVEAGDPHGPFGAQRPQDGQYGFLKLAV